MVLTPPTCWMRRNVFTKWFLSEFLLEIGKAFVVGSAVQRTCVICCMHNFLEELLVVASVVSGEKSSGRCSRGSLYLRGCCCSVSYVSPVRFVPVVRRCVRKGR